MYLKNVLCSNCKGVIEKDSMKCIGCGSECTIIHGGMISYAVFDFKIGGTGLEKFKLFWGGEYSQWKMAKMYDPRLNLEFNCCEQYMMYHKATMFNDIDMAKAIMESSSPRDQKAMGRKVAGFDVQKWEEKALDIVEHGNYLKFTQNRYLLKVMMADVRDGYTTFVEASPFDKIWGIGLAEDDPDCLDREKWLGRNWLGIAITNVKDRLVKELM